MCNQPPDARLKRYAALANSYRFIGIASVLSNIANGADDADAVEIPVSVGWLPEGTSGIQGAAFRSATGWMVLLLRADTELDVPREWETLAHELGHVLLKHPTENPEGEGFEQLQAEVERTSKLLSAADRECMQRFHLEREMEAEQLASYLLQSWMDRGIFMQFDI